MHYSCLIAKLNPRIPKRNRENEIEKRDRAKAKKNHELQTQSHFLYS